MRDVIRVDHTGFRLPGSHLEVLGMVRYWGATYAVCACDCGAVCAKVMARVLNGDNKYCGRHCPLQPRRKKKEQ